MLVCAAPQLQAQPGVAPAKARAVASAPAPSLPPTPPTIPGQLLLRLKPGFEPAGGVGNPPVIPALAGALKALNATNLRQKFPHSRAPNPARPGGINLRLLYQIKVPPTLPLAKARAVLLSTGAVEYVEPLYIRQAQYQPNDPGADSTAAGNQYYLKAIQAYRAWDIYKGDSTLVIGLTDGGVRLSHEDLRRQVKRNYADPVDGIDNDGDGYVDNFQGWDLADDDNDPGYNAASMPTALVHGSQVAGVLAAEPDNARGVAGVGFRCRFLPLSIYPTKPGGTFAGYEAIVYAADHGCQVINLSWGAPGGYSRFEQDVITYAAVVRNAVVVAAAGNTNADLRFYPASYEHVISVSGVNAQDVKSPSATFSRRIDLTAPGLDILTTYGFERENGRGPADADYSAVGGTSLAAPQVAAAAALVRGRFPELTAAQVAAQLRQTADPIDTLPGNAAYAGRLGTGRLNLARALSETDRREARVVGSRFQPARASFAPGEELQLRATVWNLLRTLTDVQVTLTSLSPYVTVSQGEFTVGRLATLDSVRVPAAAPFRLRVAAQGVPLNATATLRYRITAAGGYQSDDFVDVALNPDYVTLNAGNLALTLTSRGNLGYDSNGLFGQGATYKNGPPLLSEGGLLLATSPSRVSDRLRGTPRGTARESFFSLSQARQILNSPGAGSALADQEARVFFQDSLPPLNPDRSLGVQVRLRGQSWTAAPRRDFVLLEYSIKNGSDGPLDPLLAGLFMDWDLPGDAGRNVAAWDSVRQLGYCHSVPAPRQFAGVRLLSGGAAVTYAIDHGAPAGAPVYFTDGFSRAEKYRTLSSGTTRATRTAGGPAGADVSQVVGASLGRLAAGNSATVVFAVLAASSLAELQAAADAAQAAYAQLLPARPAAPGVGWHVYPNPAAGRLQVEVPASFALREVQLINALGQLVLRQATDSRSVSLSVAGLAPGRYTLRAQGQADVLTRTVLLN